MLDRTESRPLWTRDSECCIGFVGCDDRSERLALDLSIYFAFPTARLSERRFFTGNREWVDCLLIAFITGWFVLFFVR